MKYFLSEEECAWIRTNLQQQVWKFVSFYFSSSMNYEWVWPHLYNNLSLVKCTRSCMYTPKFDKDINPRWVKTRSYMHTSKLGKDINPRWVKKLFVYMGSRNMTPCTCCPPSWMADCVSLHLWPPTLGPSQLFRDHKKNKLECYRVSQLHFILACF